MCIIMRMYRNERPSIGDIVICKVVQVLDIGSYVELLEYNNIQGMIGVTEYSKQRIRSIAKFMNVDKIIAAEVIRTDERYIDLSKKSVESEESKLAFSNYEKNKKVQLVCRKIATLAWPDLEL